MPFEKLMERVSALGDEDRVLTMGDLAARWGEPPERIMDAVDAVRVLRGERTYISLGGEPDEPPRWHYCLTEPCEWLAIWIGPHRHLLRDDGTIGIVVERVRQQDGTWIGVNDA